MFGQQGFDVVVHTRTDLPAVTRCEGFAGVPVAKPAWIVLRSEGTTTANTQATALRSALRAALLGLDPGVRQPLVPCEGTAPRLHCGAEAEPGSTKLLVWVADEGATPDAQRELADWRARGHAVLPVLRYGRDPDLVLPPDIRHLNAKLWHGAVAEATPAVLTTSGLVPEDNRVFISYQRSQTRSLADQCFDVLSRAGFEVFLDRFRLPPGVDFAARLAGELADKTMVVVLESPDIVRSRWVRFEIAFALKNRLGLLAVHLPGSGCVGGLSGRHLVFSKTDVNGGFPYDAGSGGTQPLQDGAVARLVGAVHREHARALTHRRNVLRQSLQLALAGAGITSRDVVERGGNVCVRTGAADHVIGLSVRSAVLDDFYKVSSSLPAGGSGSLVSPLSGVQADRLARLDWLAGRSGIDHVDEGDMIDLAYRLALRRP